MSERLLAIESRLNRIEQGLQFPGLGNNQFTDFRIARTIDGGGGYPSSGNTFDIEFLDGEFTRTPGSQSAIYAPRGSTAVAHNVANEMPPQGTRVIVFFWSDHWWTNWFNSTATRTLYCIDWSGTTPDISGIPPDPPPPTDPTVVHWTNADFAGADPSMTFNAPNESITYSVGTYLITAQVTFDSEAEITSPGDLYQNPHLLENLWLLTGGRLYLQFFDTTWQTLSHSAYGFPGPANFHQSVTLRYRLAVTSGTEEVRLVFRNHSTDSDDADIRVFDAHWHSDKIA